MHITKQENAKNKIRNAIETGLYKPGQVISQRQICEDLELSVTPIREAIIELSFNGIVRRHSHRSIKITEIDEDRLRDFFYVRHLLEEEAISLCFKHVDVALIVKLKEINLQLEGLVNGPQHNLINSLDRELHNMIFAASKNKALVWTIDRVKSSFPIYALWQEPGRLSTSVKEHAKIIKALESGDVKSGIQAQHDHLSGGMMATLAYIEKHISFLSS